VVQHLIFDGVDWHAVDWGAVALNVIGILVPLVLGVTVLVLLLRRRD